MNQNQKITQGKTSRVLFLCQKIILQEVKSMSQSHIAEQMEEQLQAYEKDTAKIASKTAIKVGNVIFGFFIVKPTAKGLSALKDLIADKTQKSKVVIEDLTDGGEMLKELEITDGNIKAFDPIARKYGIKYSLKEIIPSKEELQNDQKTPSKYMVFF
jgi:folate-dependent tRNA-U54 methylase TrmFO/GidA